VHVATNTHRRIVLPFVQEEENIIAENCLRDYDEIIKLVRHGPYGWARSGGGGGGSPSTGTLHCCANVGVWQRVQYFVLPTAPFAQPSFWQRAPPPCPLQNPVPRSALLLQSFSWQRAPPPCAMQYSVLPCTPFEQPSSMQRAPPPCPLQNSVLPTACFVQPYFQLQPFRARGLCAIAPTHRLLV
jgi:hypothetical protein